VERPEVRKKTFALSKNVTACNREAPRDLDVHGSIICPTQELSMASTHVRELNELDFDATVLESKETVLVDFTAAWCSPCKVLSRLLDQIAGDLGKVTVVSVDVDSCPHLATRYGVRGMPTLVLFRDGKEAARRLGLINEQGIRDLVATKARSDAA
jgi:thioredoxin 1